jgi:hypothetical protein
MRNPSGKTRRVAMPVAAFAATAIIAITAGTAIPASASPTSLSAIRPVRCQSATFNVFYGTGSKACYEGTGQILVRVGPVSRITTGENTGYFEVILHHTSTEFVSFNPGNVIVFPAADQAELALIDITHT